MPNLNIGDAAPAFDLAAYPSGRFTLADFAGKRNILLAFYPKDDTPGCTREMCAFSDDLARFLDANTAVLGVSCDDVASHSAFAQKYKLGITLLADVDGTVGKAYGAIGDRPVADRVLFVIDKEGVVRHIHKGMPDNNGLLSVIQGLS